MYSMAGARAERLIQNLLIKHNIRIKLTFLVLNEINGSINVLGTDESLGVFEIRTRDDMTSINCGQGKKRDFRTHVSILYELFKNTVRVHNDAL
jgi:hypothetical protein